MSKKNKNFKFKLREQEQSQRQLKVSRGINLSLIECFAKEGKLDHRLASCPLSITKVTVSSDLKLANCFFVPFNTSLKAEEILDALKASKFIIRSFIARKINLKYSPEIRFFYDSAFDKLTTIENLLDKPR